MFKFPSAPPSLRTELRQAAVVIGIMLILALLAWLPKA
jgi:hypothetical protein